MGSSKVQYNICYLSYIILLPCCVTDCGLYAFYLFICGLSRFSDSPTPEEVLPSGRSKRRAAAAALHDMTNYTDRRLRKGRRTTANSSAASMPAPPTTARAEQPTGRRKRVQAAPEIDHKFPEASPRAAKRSRSNSGNNGDNFPDPEVTDDGVIQCPEPNCNKKYKHINGLRYHQSHSHHELSQQRHSNSDHSRPQTPNTDSTSKVTPRGRKKKRGRETKDTIKSEPCSPTEKMAITTRSSTPNSVPETVTPLDGDVAPSALCASVLQENCVVNGITVHTPVSSSHDQQKTDLTGSLVNPQVKTVAETHSANSSPVSGKKSKKKKSKDKDREKNKNLELTSVINPSLGTIQESKLPPQLTKQPSVEKEGSPTETVETDRPPSSLSVHSPLEVSTDSKVKTSTSDVQSPAYSDISDANDSTLTSEPVETLRIKEEPKDEDDKSHNSKVPSNNVSGGMYRQEMYPSLLRHGTSGLPVSAQALSRASPSIPQFTPPTVHQSPASSLPHGFPSRPSSRQSPVMPSANKNSPTVKVKSESTSDSRGDVQLRHDGPRTPHDMEREYRHNMCNQYAYMAAYRYGIDPGYHQHMMNTEPNYRYLYDKHVAERKYLEEHGKVVPGQRPIIPNKPQDLSGGKGMDRTTPTGGPPPLVSEKDRIQMDTDGKGKMIDYSILHEKRKDEHSAHMQRYYKYQQSPGSHLDGGKHHSAREAECVKDVKPVLSGGSSSVDSVIKSRDGYRPQDQPLDLKEKRTDQQASPKTDSKLSASPMGFGQYPVPPVYLQSPPFARGLHIDPSHPMMRAMNPGLMGYHPAAGTPPGFPSHLRYPNPPQSMDKASLLSPGGAGGPPPPEGGAKALDMLQKHASQYYQSSPTPHKIHELALTDKNTDKHRRDVPSTGPSPPLRSSTPNSKGDGDTPNKGDSRSPPPQRHLHTHHHTHVVGPPYNMYDPYAGK